MKVENIVNPFIEYTAYMNTSQLIVRICALGLFLSMISCGSEHHISSLDLEEEDFLRQIVQVDSELYYLFNHIHYVFSGGTEAQASECIRTSISKEGNQMILVFDTICEKSLTHHRSGTVNVRLVGEYLTADAQIELSFDDYLVNGWTFFGTYQFTNFQIIEGVIQSFEVKSVEASLQSQERQSISFDMGKTYTINKERLIKNGDNSAVEVDGHSFGEYNKGKKFSMYSINLLRLEMSCFDPEIMEVVSGIIAVKVDDLDGELRLDFGDGNCDRIAKWIYHSWERVVWM